MNKIKIPIQVEKGADLTKILNNTTRGEKGFGHTGTH